MTEPLEPRTNANLHSLLNRLRRRIRWYVLLEGTALLVVTAALLFWVSLGIDWFYFQVSHLELPRWFRAGFVVMFFTLLAGGLMAWIVLRLMRRFRDRALALVLERRFPELDCRLITAIEMAEDDPSQQSPLTQAMLRQTMDDLSRAVRNVSLDAVFEKRPLRRALVLSAVLLASVGGLAVANTDAIARWKAGYVDLADEYWQREYQLIARVIAQPGDRVRDFQDHRDGFDYLHPRGGELTLLIEVPEGSSPRGNPWKIPERVEVNFRVPETGVTGQATCFRVGEREFRHTFGVWSENLEIWLTGGDYTNRRPYRIITVDPPRVESIVLNVGYPPYIDASRGEADDTAREQVPVRGTRVSLPHESDFLMRIRTNKPLVRARLLFGQEELVVGAVEPSETDESWTAAGYGLFRAGTDDRSAEHTPMPLDQVVRYFSADKRELSIPFILTEAGTAAAQEYAASIDTPLGRPLRLSPDLELIVYLEDADGIIGAEPARVTINGIPDEPPLVETQLRGIGSSITRKAVIPIAGRITDDYGLSGAEFEYLIDGVGEWKPRPFRNRPSAGTREFTLQWTDGREFERFDVLPLELDVGQTLTMTVAAEDADDLNGPHIGHGERYAFKVVTDEELLSLLYQRELNLRQRFERIIEELKEVQQDLQLHRERATEWEKLAADPSSEQADREKRLRELEAAVTASAERSLLTVRKDANETAAVEQSFRDVREELVNNAVHTPQILERLDDRIISPLHAVNSRDYDEVDGALGLLKLALDKNEQAVPRIEAVQRSLESMLARMERILLEMRKLETFQEAVELLKGIIGDQERLSEDTQTERKREAIKKLQGLGIEND